MKYKPNLRETNDETLYARGTGEGWKLLKENYPDKGIVYQNMGNIDGKNYIKVLACCDTPKDPNNHKGLIQADDVLCEYLGSLDMDHLGIDYIFIRPVEFVTVLDKEQEGTGE